MAEAELQERESATQWLSEPRLQSYLDPCDDDLHAAMQLYRWNLQLAQAVLHDVALFEVAIRNAYDRCITQSFAGDWLLDSTSPVRRPIMRTNRRGNTRDQNWINRRVIDELATAGRSHDWIVSNLTLGFWAHMTDRSHERDLWIPYLHQTWPTGTSRAVLADKVATINSVRNRAVHHEHLFNPARANLSVMRSSAFVTELYPLLVPQTFLDAFPDLRPDGVLSFLAGSPVPAGVSL